MRTIKLVSAFAMMLFAACNSGTSTQSTSDTTAATDTSQEAAVAIAPLPAVPANAKVFFRNLKNMQTVTSPFKVEMGVTGMAVDTAGAVKDSSGHFHILIDAGDSIPSGEVVPKDSTHLHYGKAQTETELSLTPGMHTLTLQFADGIHRSYGSKMAASVMVTVKKK